MPRKAFSSLLAVDTTPGKRSYRVIGYGDSYSVALIAALAIGRQ